MITLQGIISKTLKGINLEIAPGTIYGFFNNNNSQALVNILSLSTKPELGTIVLDHCNTNALKEEALKITRRQIGIISEDSELLESRNVFDNIALPLTCTFSAGEEVTKIVLQIAQFFSLEDKLSAYPTTLSKAEKQLVALARAMTLQPKVLICNNLHYNISYLKKINSCWQTTIIFIHNDLEIMKQLCTHMAVLQQGELVEHGSFKDLYLNPQTTFLQKAQRRGVLGKLPLTITKNLSDHASATMLGRFIFAIDCNINQAIATASHSYNLRFNIIQIYQDVIAEKKYGILIAEINKDNLETDKLITYFAKHKITLQVLGYVMGNS